MTRRELFFILLAFVSAAAYLGFAFSRGASGFPLDDAWIHQVYARNLGTRGEFAFFAGQPSAGSTSPLWTILLSIGYTLHIDFRAWTYLLGAALFGASVIMIARLADRLPQVSGRKSQVSLLAVYYSLFTLFEWHLAWSAVSGMEIPLFIFLSLVLVERFFARERVLILGLLAGLLTLTRPEGVALGALVGLGIILDADKHRSPQINYFYPRLSALIRVPILFALGFAILIVPYLAFNLAVSGAIFPNTFYAKNAEYAILIEQTPLVLRLAQTLAAPWVGAQILLLPGFLFIVARLAKNRDWGTLVPVAWILTLPALYALRLPVTYQHARYEMPVVPFIIVYGVWGTTEMFGRIRSFVVRGVWVASTGAVLIAFWLIGALQYATDVSFIDCEMVQTAHWVAVNAPGDAVIAAHDIGALGYFYDRPFIDLAGLASPEVIPFIRDESRLRDFLFSRHAAFVIVFPDWYSSLTHGFDPVFQTGCAVTREQGGTNMTVYQLK